MVHLLQRLWNGAKLLQHKLQVGMDHIHMAIFWELAYWERFGCIPKSINPLLRQKLLATERTGGGEEEKKKILRGPPRGHGGHDWKNKFNLDPKDPASWPIILELMKRTVDESTPVQNIYTNNNAIVYYFDKFFYEYGNSLRVVLYQSAPELYSLVDA